MEKDLQLSQQLQPEQSGSEQMNGACAWSTLKATPTTTVKAHRSETSGSLSQRVRELLAQQSSFQEVSGSSPACHTMRHLFQASLKETYLLAHKCLCGGA